MSRVLGGTRSRLVLALAVVLGAAAAIALVAGGPADGERGTAASTDRWQPLASSPLQRTEVGAARIGRFIYVLGGFVPEPSGESTNQVARYDIDSDSWSMVREMPLAVNHPAVAAHRGRLYVHGGYTGRVAEATNRLFRYTPATDTWSELRPSGTPRAAHTLVPIGRRLYAAGGANSSGALRLLQIYNPARNRWSRGPSMGVAREHIGGAALGGKLYVIAGRAAGANLKVVERYDPKAKSWERLRPVLVATSGFQAARAAGRIVIAGGEQLEEGENTIGTVEVFNPRTGRWRLLPSMLTPRHGLGVVARGRRIFALEGGPRPGLSFANTLEFLDLPGR